MPGWREGPVTESVSTCRQLSTPWYVPLDNGVSKHEVEIGLMKKRRYAYIMLPWTHSRTQFIFNTYTHYLQLKANVKILILLYISLTIILLYGGLRYRMDWTTPTVEFEITLLTSFCALYNHQAIHLCAFRPISIFEWPTLALSPTYTLYHLLLRTFISQS